MKEKIAEIVKKYKIYEPANNKGMLGVNRKICKNPEDKDFVKKHKQEILDFLHEEKERKDAEYKERRRREKEWEHSIGLDILRNTIRDVAEKKIAFDKAFESGDGIYPKYPDFDSIGRVKEKYPVAAAYLKAESWSEAAHYAKCSAGRKAKARIKDGEDHKKVIEDMEKEWAAYCDEHIWD